MKADLLREVCPALYGEHWQAALARDLGVTPRSVNRWLALDSMPDDMVERLRPLAAARCRLALGARARLWSKRAR